MKNIDTRPDVSQDQSARPNIPVIGPNEVGANERVVVDGRGVSPDSRFNIPGKDVSAANASATQQGTSQSWAAQQAAAAADDAVAEAEEERKAREAAAAAERARKEKEARERAEADRRRTGSNTSDVNAEKPSGMNPEDSGLHSEQDTSRPTGETGAAPRQEDYEEAHATDGGQVREEIVDPYNQLTNGLFERDEDLDVVSYDEAQKERVKRADNSETSKRAQDSDDGQQVSGDEVARRRRIVSLRRKVDPIDKPKSFKSFVKGIANKVTAGSRGVLSNRRSKKQAGRISDEFAKDFKARFDGGYGRGFFAQLIGDPDRRLKLHQVGIGKEEVIALVEQAPEYFENILRQNGCDFDTIIPEPGEPVDIEKIRTLVNTAENGVWVVVSKSPEVQLQDVELMQLVIPDNIDRGIVFHPIVAPFFNADFDGDQPFIFLDAELARRESRNVLSVMDYMVNWEGGTGVSGDWLWSVRVSKGTDVRKFVRDNVFDRWKNMGHRLDGVVDAMAKLIDDEFAEANDKMNLWKNLFKQARAMAPNDDVLMSNVIEAAYNYVRDQGYDTYLHTYGTPVDESDLPQARTEDDATLIQAVNYFIEAQMPPNWQATRALFHNFPGNIEKKNPPFRFNGDIGRQFSKDPRIRVEIDKLQMSEDGFYEVSSDADWEAFHRAVAKYVAAQKIGLEKKKDERWQDAQDAFRYRVIRRMSSYVDGNGTLYSDDLNMKDGVPQDGVGVDFDFIERFTSAYNAEVNLSNMSVVVISDRFERAEWGDRKPIEVDSQGRPVNMGAVATAILEVYPAIIMRKLCPDLVFKDADPQWVGNPYHQSTNLHSHENEYHRDKEDRQGWWLAKRYMNMPAINFSRRNRVIWNNEHALEDIGAAYSDIKKSGNRMWLQGALMLAIADKKTSAASTYNKALTGSWQTRGERQLCHMVEVEEDGEKKKAERYYNATYSGNREAGETIYGKNGGKGYTKTAMDRFADLLCELIYLDKDSIKDRTSWMEDLVFVATELFPDLAYRFDLDSIEGFHESKYGKIFMSHALKAMEAPYTDEGRKIKNQLVDHVASTWMAVIAEDAMSDVYDKSEMLDNAESAEDMSGAVNALAFAWNKLFNRSQVWEGIVREIQSGGEAWAALHEAAVNNEKNKDKKDKDQSGIPMLSEDYWKEHESGNIVDVLLDTDMLYGRKVEIITDIVRWQTNDPWLNSYEIPFQMRIADNQLYSRSSANRKSALGDIIDYRDAYSSWAKTSRYKMLEQIKKAYTRYGPNKETGKLNAPGRLLRTIENMAKMPWTIYRISDSQYANEFVAILDRTSHQQEKGSQAGESKHRYEETATAHTGHPFSDLYQTDGRVVDIMSVDDISLHDFFEIFSDWNKELTFYDHSGAICSASAASILTPYAEDKKLNMSDREAVERALWEFLLANPRIASMLRIHDVCSAPDGGAWIGVSNNHSIEATINLMGNEEFSRIYDPIAHANYLLDNHFGLDAVVALCDPIGNRTSREYPKSTEATRNWLLVQICEAARKYNAGNDDIFTLAEGILGEFGVTLDNMIEANSSQYSLDIKELGEFDEDLRELGDEEAEQEAIDLYSIARMFVKNYIEEVAENLDFSASGDSFSGRRGMRNEIVPPKDIRDRKVDRSSVLSFVDVCQELGASKTSTSTGVNGQITLEHAEWIRFIDERDTYASIEQIMDEGDIDESYLLGFNGALTSVLDKDGNFIPFMAEVDEETGKVITNYDQLKELEDEDIVVYTTGLDVRDLSTRKDGKHTAAHHKHMTSKRAKGSEELNLKLKKFGIDLRDSIIKMVTRRRTDRTYKDMIEILNTTYQTTESMMAVHLALGLELYNAAQELEYEDLSLADFTSIASIMAIKGDDGAIYIRSLEQLSNAIRYQTSRLDHEPTADEMRDFVNRIVNDGSTNGVGIRMFNAGEVFDRFRPAGVSSSTLPTRRHSSNETRNRQMLETYEREQRKPNKPEFTQADAERIANKIFKDGKRVPKQEKKDSKDSKKSGTDQKSGAKRVSEVKVDEVGKQEQAKVAESKDAKATEATEKQQQGETEQELVWKYTYSNLREVVKRCHFMRTYNPIAGIGVKTKEQIRSRIQTKSNADKKRSEGRSVGQTSRSRYAKSYSTLEPFANVPDNAIGPRNAFVIGDGQVSQSEFNMAMKTCYERGMTVIVSGRHIDLINNCEFFGKKDDKSAIPIDRGSLLSDAIAVSSSGDMIIPFFDMRLNGSEVFPVDGRGASYRVRNSDYIRTFERKDLKSGDAEIEVYAHFARRARVVEDGEQVAIVQDLFPGVYNTDAYSNYNRVIRRATPDEIRDLIVNIPIDSADWPTIDMGLYDSNSGENAFTKRSFRNAIQRYKDRWALIGGNVSDTTSSDLKPGDIVDWMVCEIINPRTNDTRYVFAPVIPFPLDGPMSVPPVYSIKSIDRGGYVPGMSGDLLSVKWKNESTIYDNTIKAADPMSGACKGVAYVPSEDSFDPDDDRLVLETGNMIDMSMQEAATGSRKEGTDKRLKTLVTLMVELRSVGYNFGLTEGAFPNNPDLADRLGFGEYVKAEDENGQMVDIGRITRTEWRELLSDRNFRFSNDPRVNRFLWVESKKLLERGMNPSDLMSNLVESNGTIRNSDEGWDYETTLEPRMDYENDLLHFFHTIDPHFCPDGVKDMSEDHFFRMWRDENDEASGYDAGQVQMRIPQKDSDGNWYKVWFNVYSGEGYFMKQSSALSRPDVKTSELNPSAAHALLYTHYGLEFSKRRESKLLNWAIGGLRTNWAGRRGTPTMGATGGANTSGNANVSDATTADTQDAEPRPGSTTEVPHVDINDVTDAVNGTSEDTDTTGQTDGERVETGEPEVNVPRSDTSKSKSTGYRSPILEELRRRTAEKKEREATRDERVAQAKKNAIENNGRGKKSGVTQEDLDAIADVDTDDLMDYLDLEPEDVEEVDMDEVYANDQAREILDDIQDDIANSPDPDALQDFLTRIRYLTAFKKKFGDLTSNGTGYNTYDIDFENYDFSDSEPLSPIHSLVVEGKASTEMRNSYIFNLERARAEKGGYLEDWLEYWDANTIDEEEEEEEEEEPSTEGESGDSGKPDSKLDDDARLSLYLRGIGARATVDDIKRTERAARAGKKSYNEGNRIGLRHLAREYAAVYRQVAENISGLANELENAIENRDLVFPYVDISRDLISQKKYANEFERAAKNGDTPIFTWAITRNDIVSQKARYFSDGYGVLNHLYQRCDDCVSFFLLPSSDELRDLDQIRKLIEDGKLSGTTLARKELTEAVHAIDEQLTRIENLKADAYRALHKDTIEFEKQQILRQGVEQYKAKNKKIDVNEVDYGQIKKLVEEGKIELIDAIRSVDERIARMKNPTGSVWRVSGGSQHKAVNEYHRENQKKELKALEELKADLQAKLQERDENNRAESEREYQNAGDWARTGKNAEKSVSKRIETVFAPRVERSQKRLKQYITGNLANEREKELARAALKFIEILEIPTRLKVKGFTAETRTSSGFKTEKDGKRVPIQNKQARPSWGWENDEWLERAQKYLGTGGGKLRIMKIVMYRLAIGLSTDGTIAHVSADDFEISESQIREAIKDVIAYCENGLLPTDLYDDVIGDPRAASRDSSGRFVTVAGVKRYPVFMSWDMWYEICNDPTSKFWVKGESAIETANRRYKEGIESWLKNVHNVVEREGDLEQLTAIDNLARAVLSMDSRGEQYLNKGVLPELQTSFDLEALASDAARSNDQDMAVPLRYMLERQREAGIREYENQERRLDRENQFTRVLRTDAFLRKTMGTIRSRLLITSPVEETENIFRANIANAVAAWWQLNKDDRKLRETKFNYNDREYRKVTDSPQFAENMQVVAALMRIGDEDLLDLYLSEKDKAGNPVNTKFTKAELHSFLVRNGYIRGHVPGKNVKAKVTNVSRDAQVMAERIMTDFAMSEDLPGFSRAEARTFARTYMCDAMVLYSDLERRKQDGQTNEYAYAVDVADAVATAQAPGLGTSALVRKMISTPTGRETLATMGWFGAGRKNFVSATVSKVMRESAVTESLITNCINAFPCYGIGKHLTEIPMSSTVCYLITAGYSEIGDLIALSGERRSLLGIGLSEGVASNVIRVGNAMSRAADHQMGTRSSTLSMDEETGRIRQRKLSAVGLRKNIIYDLTMATSTISKMIITMQIINHMGLTPPEDPDRMFLYQEWRLGRGDDTIKFNLAWWMDDLTGISVPLAIGILVNEGGPWEFTDENGNVVLVKDGKEMASSIIWNGIASINDGTSVFEAIDLFTHWDEHWMKALGMDDLNNIGVDDTLAPKGFDEWFNVTARDALLNHFGKLTPAIINEIVPSSKDCVFMGDRLDTTPYLKYSTKDGKITMDEAIAKNITESNDDWAEVRLLETTRKYVVIGALMNALSGSHKYTWADMPKAERMDKAAYVKWSDYSFDFTGVDDAETKLSEQGKQIYDHILSSYASADDAAMDGFYLSYDALANARAYCKSKRAQLKIDHANALDSIWGIGSSYNEIKARIEEEYKKQDDEITRVNDILWSNDFPVTVPKYYQQTTDWLTNYVDSEGNPSDVIQYFLGNATKEQIAYGNDPNSFSPFVMPRTAGKGWNQESPTWNMTGNEELDDETSRQMYKDLVEGNSVYVHKDGTIEDLGKTYFGGTNMPGDLMLSEDNNPTTGTRIDVAKTESLPSYLKSEDALAEYFKKATGVDYDGLNTSDSATPVTTDTPAQDDGTTGTTDAIDIVETSDTGKPSTTPAANKSDDSGSDVTKNPVLNAILAEYGIDGNTKQNQNNNGNGYGGGYTKRYYGSGYGGYSRSYYSSGGGDSAYRPKIYNTSKNVSSRGAASMSPRSPYSARTTYLRPSFYTSGSRKSSLKMM